MTEAKTVTFSMPGGTGAAAIARRSVVSIEVGLPLGVRHRVALMLSELVANAVQHGGANAAEVVEVRVTSTPARVRVEVVDPGWQGVEPPSASSTRTAATACCSSSTSRTAGVARPPPRAAASPGSSWT